MIFRPATSFPDCSPDFFVSQEEKSSTFFFTWRHGTSASILAFQVSSEATGKERLAPSWRLCPLVSALQALRGVQFHVAVTTAAELGDLTRFDNPRQLMAYLGLHPSEHSSGDRRRQGGIAKTGNSHARRALIEGAWSYRYPAKVSRIIQVRQESLPRDLCDIAWKAQVRLCKRFRKLTARGKHPNVVVTAIARELVAFMWSIARHVEIPAARSAGAPN